MTAIYASAEALLPMFKQGLTAVRQGIDQISQPFELRGGPSRGLADSVGDLLETTRATKALGSAIAPHRTYDASSIQGTVAALDTVENALKGARLVTDADAFKTFLAAVLDKASTPNLVR